MKSSTFEPGLMLKRTEFDGAFCKQKSMSLCHSVSFVMYVSGAKFEEHCSNISEDILDGVLYCFSGTTYDVITFIIQKRKYCISKKKKNIFPKGKRHSFFL